MADFAAPGGSRPSRGTGNVSANFDATDMTAFTASVLATEHPAVIATAGLHADFMQAYIVHSTSQDVPHADREIRKPVRRLLSQSEKSD
ncbi:hypothetical protein MRX96_056026 [Rhipicephalus microplus]